MSANVPRRETFRCGALIPLRRAGRRWLLCPIRKTHRRGGTAVNCWRSRRRTPARPVRRAATSTPTTARRKRCSSASSAGTPSTPTSLARSIFSGRATPVVPVERRRCQAPRRSRNPPKRLCTRDLMCSAVGIPLLLAPGRRFRRGGGGCQDRLAAMCELSAGCGGANRLVWRLEGERTRPPATW